MRRWLLIGGFAGLAVLGIWLGVRAQRPTAPGGEARTAAPGTTPGVAAEPVARPAGAAAARELAAPAADPGGGGSRPRVGKSLVPQFDPILEKLADDAQRGDLEKAARDNGFKLKGDRIRVIVRATLGSGDKVQAAITAAGGEVIRAVDRDSDQQVYVAWVPVRSLRTLAENDAVRNLHRPVGIHANEIPERKPPDPPPPSPPPP